MRPSINASRNGADRQTAALRQMTVDQLLDLGTRQVVYLRADTCDGESLFVLYGADGVPLVTVDDIETVVEIAAEHGLAFVSVH
jgi:hypothetical protein